MKRRERSATVLAASGGGHFDMVAAISSAVAGQREWVTVEGPRSRSLEQNGEVVHTVPTFDLDHFNLTNPLRSVILALRLRPRVVMTTGAGVVFTFVAVSWLLGARVVFVETMARVSTPSKTGTALARLADLHIVQWPELTQRFPRSKLCKPALLPDHVELNGGGRGTFVSLGTHTAAFERLVEMVEAAVTEGVLAQPCLIQGATGRSSSKLAAVPNLSPEEFRNYIRQSQHVVGHAGAGFISTSLSQGRRPIVVPRLAIRGEHVDDHQLQLARKLAQLGLVVNAETGMDAETIREAEAPLAYGDIFADLPSATDLVTEYLTVPTIRSSLAGPVRRRSVAVLGTALVVAWTITASRVWRARRRP